MQSSLFCVPKDTESSVLYLQKQLKNFGYETADIVQSSANALRMADRLFNKSMEGAILTVNGGVKMGSIKSC